MKKLAWIAVSLFLAGLAGPPGVQASSELGINGAAASASVNFAIRIPSLLRMRTVHSALQVEVPQAAVLTRVVDVLEAAMLEVQSNMRKPYELRFDITDPDVEAVEIHGFDQPVRVTREGRSVRLWPVANIDMTRRLSLRYTIRYAEGVRAGVRPIPVVYSLSTGA